MEWNLQLLYGVAMLPICKGIRPEHGGGHQGHMPFCKLGNVLSAQENVYEIRPSHYGERDSK
jgi:hypothetical protein